MRTILHLTTLFLLSSLSLSAQTDEDFELASVSSDGTSYYVYIEKTNFDNSKNTWIKYTSPIKKIKNKKGKIIETGGEKTLMFMKIDCEDHEYDLLNITVYKKNGELKHSDDTYEFGNKIIPGSVISNIYDHVCNK